MPCRSSLTASTRSSSTLAQSQPQPAPTSPVQSSPIGEGVARRCEGEDAAVKVDGLSVAVSLSPRRHEVVIGVRVQVGDADEDEQNGEVQAEADEADGS